MQWTLAWFEWKAEWWETQTTLWEVGDPSILTGVSAYRVKDTRPAREQEQGDKEAIEDDEGVGAREVPSDEEDSDKGKDVVDLDM